MHSFVINTVPADGLAPLGATPSASTVITEVQVLSKWSWENGTDWMGSGSKV